MLRLFAETSARGRTYYYAWRGGPRIFGEPGSAEFVKSFLAARETLKAPPPDRIRWLVTQYKSGPFRKLAPSTRRGWVTWLDRIGETFGDLPIRLADHPEKIRPLIRDWRNQWAATPRSADHALQVLSVLFGYAVDPLGLIQNNPCIGMKRLYTSNRSDLIWTDDALLALKAQCSPEVWWAVQLAAHTGLRKGDLVRLTWSDVKDDEIVVRTSKTGAFARIPIYNALRQVLNAIPKRSPVILTVRVRRE